MGRNDVEDVALHEIVRLELTEGLDEHLVGDPGNGSLERPVPHAAVLCELPQDEGLPLGVPPTGKAIVLTGTYIRRVADGRVAEEWDTTDIFGLAQQLGMIPG